MKPATMQNRAHILIKKSDVRVRVVALLALVVQQLRYGLHEAMLEAADPLQVSKSKDNGAAMIAAVALRVKLNGLLVERREVMLTEAQRLTDVDLCLENAASLGHPMLSDEKHAAMAKAKAKDIGF